MELRHLRYFAKAAETLNFSDAAKALNIAQSSLSQQIRQLEDELGIQLFIRNSHSIRLTEAGQVMLPFALRTIHEAQTCADRIHDLQKLLTGTLNIGVTHSFSPILTESVISFMKMYPGIKLNIVYKQMNELMELLVKRDIDFVLAFRPIDPIPEIESHILFQNTLSAVVARDHPLATLPKVTVPELQRYDLALPAKGLQARNAFDSIVSDTDSFKIRIELNDVNTLLKLVQQTCLVTVLAEDSIYDVSEVRAIPIDDPGSQMTGCVHVLRDSYRKHSMQEFVRILTESLAVKRLQSNWI